MAEQLLSQICPTERRDPDASLGNACDLVVVVVRLGRGNWVVAVDVITLPFGTMTWTAGLELEFD